MRPLASDAQKHDRWNRNVDCSPQILATAVTFWSFENIFLPHNISVCHRLSSAMCSWQIVQDTSHNEYISFVSNTCLYATKYNAMQNCTLWRFPARIAEQVI